MTLRIEKKIAGNKYWKLPGRMRELYVSGGEELFDGRFQQVWVYVSPKTEEGLRRAGEIFQEAEMIERDREDVNAINPWKHFNLTEQMRLTRHKPELARRLRAEAGVTSW